MQAPCWSSTLHSPSHEPLDLSRSPVFLPHLADTSLVLDAAYGRGCYLLTQYPFISSYSVTAPWFYLGWPYAPLLIDMRPMTTSLPIWFKGKLWSFHPFFLPPVSCLDSEIMAGAWAAVLDHEATFRIEASRQDSEQEDGSLSAWGQWPLPSASSSFYMRGNKNSVLSKPCYFWSLVPAGERNF